MAGKNKDGLLGAFLRQVAISKPLPYVFPAITAADAIVRYGAQRLTTPPRPASRPAATKPPRPAPKPTPDQNGNWLDRSPTAKFVGGAVVRSQNIGPGVAQGAWELVKDGAGAINFVSRLLDPNDAYYSPRGEAAWDQVVRAPENIARSINAVIEHPRVAAQQAKQGLQNFNVSVNPFAQPQAATFEEEMRRQKQLGRNQGKLGFDVVSSLYGGAVLKGTRAGRLLARAPKTGAALNDLRLATLAGRAPTAADYMARDIAPGLAEYFAQPYQGWGHHYWGRNRPLPSWLGGGKLPPVILESPFNVLKPSGLTFGEMYELHCRVDPAYSGGKIPAEFGGGRWRAEDLGWEPYGKLGRVWYGAPAPLKAAIGTPLVVGAGAAVDYFDGEKDVP